MAESSTIPQPIQTLHPLQDRVAIVTGGSRGIGRGIALHLASLGAKVLINYASSSAQADRVADQINSSSSSGSTHPRAVTFQADISDPGQVKSLFDAAESAFNSPVHILVNSAGVVDSKYPTLASTTTEDFDTTFSINTRGASGVVEAQVCCVRGVEGGCGDNGEDNGEGAEGDGITANCVAPGPVATDMFYEGDRADAEEKAVAECPLGRMGKVDDVAPVVGFLASDAGDKRVFVTRIINIILLSYHLYSLVCVELYGIIARR
ncbi:hypothetical protein Pfo_028160 [Paulownia fortunei]|nr:hypothetical protein Pfo_028160 [Paulownia fortunei]